MSAAQGAGSDRSALIRVYREGLGLAAVVVIHGPGVFRILATEGDGERTLAAGDVVKARWWCRRRMDAERVATAAMSRLQRHALRDEAQPSLAHEAIAGAAKRLNVALHADEEISAEAMGVIARVDEEVESLQRSGELKSINKSYRIYRMEASARGEKVIRYAEWLEKYKQTLVRELAVALRYV